MSFAFETKNELCRIQNTKECCRKAECYGLLLFTRAFSVRAGSLTTENQNVARLMAQHIAEVTGAFADVEVSIRHKGAGVFTLSIPGENQRLSVLQAFGHTGTEITRHINLSNIENECCVSAFLRGAFLACGTVTDPAKDYHLEFSALYRHLAADLAVFLESVCTVKFQPSVTQRKGTYVVYLKGSEQIADLLTYMGASGAAMNLMQAKMLKEVRNYANRKTNFETANIDKTVSASAKQVRAIKKIEGTIGISELPEELREIAQLRMENPEMSLRELGERLSISRSGANHRIQRILSIAADIHTPQ